jgi:hypothetical protein
MMKTIRTAVLDELYEHYKHLLGDQETLGVDPESGLARHLEYVAVKRDEGRIIIKTANLSSMNDRTVMREIAITVEKT